MTTFIELSEDAFAALFKPIANHLNPNASFDWGDGYGTLFETYDEELAYVRTQNPSKVWTLVSGDDGEHVTSGFHFVNRLGYFVSQTAIPDGVDIQIALETVESTSKLSLANLTASVLSVVDYLGKNAKRSFIEAVASDPTSRSFQPLTMIRKWLNVQ